MKKGFTLIELMIVVAIIAIIAAIAIPNLLQSRMQANESNAVAALKAYATGQATWKKAKYTAGSDTTAGFYAADYKNLSDKGLIPDVFAKASTSDSEGYQGYYFINEGNAAAVGQPGVTGWNYDFGLFSTPCAYNMSGINSFHVGAEGTVKMSNMDGAAPAATEDISAWLDV